MKLLVPIATVLAGAVLLAGCTAPEPPPLPSAPVTAPTSATASPSASASPSPSVTEEAPPPPSRLPTGTISADDFLKKVMAAELTSYSTDVTISGSQGGDDVAMSATADIAESDPKKLTMRMTMSMTGMELETIIVKGVAFTRTPAVGPGWYKVSTDQASSALGFGQMGVMQEWAEKARQHIKQVETTGDDVVDGEPTTHYIVTFDAKAVGAIMGGGSGTAKLKTDTFSYDVWLDADGRCRKFAMTLEVGDSPSTVQGTASNFGKKFDIKAPEKYSELS